MNRFNTIEEWLDYYMNIKSIRNFYTVAIKDSVPNVTLKDVYFKCEEYRKQGKLDTLFEMRCPECADIVGIYDSITDIPNDAYCIKCGYEEFNTLNDAIVLYKFIRN